MGTLADDHEIMKTNTLIISRSPLNIYIPLQQIMNKTFHANNLAILKHCISIETWVFIGHSSTVYKGLVVL